MYQFSNSGEENNESFNILIKKNVVKKITSNLLSDFENEWVRKQLAI